MKKIDRKNLPDKPPLMFFVLSVTFLKAYDRPLWEFLVAHILTLILFILWVIRNFKEEPVDIFEDKKP